MDDSAVHAFEKEKQDLLKYAEDRISTSQHKINELEQKLNRVTLEYENCFDLSTKRLNVIKALEREIGFLTEQHDQRLEAEQGDLMMQIAENMNERRLLALANCDLEKNYRVASSNQYVLILSNNEKRQLINALDARYRKCKTARDIAEAKNKLQDERMSELNEILAKSTSEVDSLRAAIQLKELERTELVSKHDTAIKTRETQFDEAVKALESENATLKQDFNSLQAENERLVQEQGSQNDSLEGLKTQLSGLNDSLTTKVHLIEQKDQEIAALKDQIEQQKEQFLSLEFDRDEARHVSEMRTKQLASLEAEHADSLKKLSELEHKYSRESSEWEKRKEDLKKFAAECDDAVSEWRVKFHDMREQLFSTKESHALTLDKLKDELRDSRIDQATLKTRIVQLESSLASKLSGTEAILKPVDHIATPKNSTSGSVRRVRKPAKEDATAVDQKSDAESFAKPTSLSISEANISDSTSDTASEEPRKRRRILHNRKPSAVVSPKKPESSSIPKTASATVEDIFATFSLPEVIVHEKSDV